MSDQPTSIPPRPTPNVPVTVPNSVDAPQIAPPRPTPNVPKIIPKSL